MTNIHGQQPETNPVSAHRILDDLSEIIADCELLLPMIVPVYSVSKRVHNIRRLAIQLAQEIAGDPTRRKDCGRVA